MFKGLHEQSLDVYQVRDTVLDSNYIKQCGTRFMHNV